VVSAFNERLAEIEALVARERAFASAASHELRTPLAVIRGAAEVLAGQHGRNAVLERIERAVGEAAQDLDALLALSRARELPPAEPQLLHRLLPQWAEPYEATARSQHTALGWALQPCTVSAPPGVLGIVFTNLLRNALRAAAGGTVRVELDAQRLVVADDGPGIAPADLPQLFEPGVRRSEGGSGMGLYIARTLAQRCGFSLHLHSELGHGTRAELALHPAPASQPDPGMETA
jgi:signal transduction histidine kinase